MKQYRTCILYMANISFLLFLSQVVLANSSYNPLAVSSQFKLETLDIVVQDAKREREIPIRVYFPPKKSPVPVILFSHGLGGSREGNKYLGNHWAARGYLVVFLQHPGSDISVFKNIPLDQRKTAIRKAVGMQSFLLRIMDIPSVLDQLNRWNKAEGHLLEGRMNLMRIGMSGHSYGAKTTQAVSGQRTLRGRRLFPDTRIKAAIAFSPSSSRRNKDPEEIFGTVKIPWMLMTGTRDITRMGGADMKSRLAVFPALPPGGKYQLVLHGAHHSAFTDRTLPADRAPRNKNHHRVILSISTAFWDAWLHDNALARAWLDGNGPNSVLEKEDQWKRK